MFRGIVAGLLVLAAAASGQADQGIKELAAELAGKVKAAAGERVVRVGFFTPSGIEGYFEGLGTPYVQGEPSPGRVMDRELLDRVAPAHGIIPFFDDETGASR